MPVETASTAETPENFLRSRRGALVSWNDRIRYLAEPSMPEEDLRHYIQDPLEALPAAVMSDLPDLTILLVPFLKTSGGEAVEISFSPIPPDRSVPFYQLNLKEALLLVFAVKEEEVSEYHYTLYHLIAGLLASQSANQWVEPFGAVVREELSAKVHGEIDEKSWQLKQSLQAKPAGKDSKAFREYLRQAFTDTMTLYLHGICCDIDVETGPRQMPSRSVRKRLQALHALYPPPAGHAVFPEELKTRAGR